MEELLSQLRDIQTPPVPANLDGFALRWEPLAVFACATVFMGLITIWRRQKWRRTMRFRLDEVRNLPDALSRWQALVRLAMEAASRSGGSDALPDCIHIPGTRAGPKDVARIEEFVRRASRFRLAR